jgi:pimeloyl-ACP methyl ester carboxylesterase
MAERVIALADHLGLGRAHFVGIVGIGACIFREVAIRRPDLVRSLVNSGCWARVDPYLAAQMDLWLDVHRHAGFDVFQRTVVLESFRPDYFAARGHRLLGPDGGWKELRDNLQAHARLTEAAKGHDTLDRLGRIAAPTLVFHNGEDRITGPRLTRPVQAGIPGAIGHDLPQAAHVVTGRDAVAAFAGRILEFLQAH